MESFKSFISELTAKQKAEIADRKARRGGGKLVKKGAPKKKPTTPKQEPEKKGKGLTPAQLAAKDARRDGAGRSDKPLSKAQVSKGDGEGKNAKGEEQSIIMSLRKAQDAQKMGGDHSIKVSPTGKTVKVSSKSVDRLLSIYDKLEKPEQKRKFRIGLIKKLRGV